MSTSLPLIRTIVTIFSFSTSIGLCFSLLSEVSPVICLISGLAGGSGITLLLRGCEDYIHENNLKTILTLLIGLTLGLLVSQTLGYLVSILLEASQLLHVPAVPQILQAFILIGSIYISLLTTARAADTYAFQFPFSYSQPPQEGTNDLLVGISALSDSRIVEVASTGFFDHLLVVPKPIIRLLENQTTSDSDNGNSRRALETLRRLEAIDHLDLKFIDAPLFDSENHESALFNLANSLDARVLTAELSRVQENSKQFTKTVSLQRLATALKPLMEGGEIIELKIQRYGKEPRQGVGYLEDGTMVVVNGGGDYIDTSIKCIVLSVKHTCSGRMIFCNVAENEENTRPCRIKEREKGSVSLPTNARSENSHDYFNV